MHLDKVQWLEHHFLKALPGFILAFSLGKEASGASCLSQRQNHTVQLYSNLALKYKPKEVEIITNYIYNII